MLNQPAEYFLHLHAAEQSRFLAAAEHRRNAERRRAGTADPLRPGPAHSFRPQAWGPDLLRRLGFRRPPARAGRSSAALLTGPMRPVAPDCCP
ncbi:MAG: hypothetical protein AVDCRST_MAG83-254 [uncultured Arthrobacter sp.]|uniref:Uncharacterized protein n=1 Tax=uncultured Arthrobacter sp. TaxID=114050 RepID=A0A6J4H972_9MICC|nr:hypothetical protein [uncultured Arthrobacter sp.]CAA9216880.1 MAG: hypothetical protein AVDCRST_MAG83-254 [uncultured Arthrobacter sp.]